MNSYQRILVGVDLSSGDRYVGQDLDPPAREAVRMALALAKTHAAELVFCYVLDDSSMQLSARQELLAEQERGEPTILGQAEAMLAGLVAAARDQEVEAAARVLTGRSWRELIQEVQRAKHDLVVVGARQHSGVRTALLGSTAIKLMRKCPCPVWISKPRTSNQIRSILVATDLSPVGDAALEVGGSLASQHGAALHVLYAYEHPADVSLLPAELSALSAAEHRTAAEQLLRTKLESLQLPDEPRLYLPAGYPCPEILECLERERIELLVMGTISRTGVTGMITGSNAERLLPRIPCSVLALKPADFCSPVAAETS